MLRIIYSLLFLSWVTITNTHFFQKYKVSEESILVFNYQPVVNSKLSHWSYFFSAAFEFPALLQEAASEKIKVVVICPQELDGLSPIDDKAPLIEGARVAIAWASAYFRFHNVDVKIIKCPSNADPRDIIRRCNENPTKRESKTIEQAMGHRIINWETFKINEFSKTNIEKIDYQYQSENKKPILIIPKKNSSPKVIITGAAGFLGSHLCKRFLQDGYHVIGLDSLICATENNISELRTNENFEFYRTDVSKPYDVYGPVNLILHLASVPSPEFYYKLPVETLSSGLNGVRNGLDLALKKGARFFFSSTSEVYGDPLVSPQSEDYVGNVNCWGKRSQYDQSKRGAETICKYYFEKYGLDIRIARIFNTYGPGMQLNDGRAVTNFIQAILTNNPMVIYGDGLQTRSFCFVSDLIEGLMLIINADMDCAKIANRIFNVGNDKEFTINHIAQTFNKLAVINGIINTKIEFIENPDATDPKQRKPDLTRIKKLGYDPKIDLENGLEMTLKHFIKI